MKRNRLRNLGLILALGALAVLVWNARRARDDELRQAAVEADSADSAAAVRAEEELERELAGDQRLARYLEGCARDEPFLVDTSDLIPRLVGRLERASSPEPLAQAREDLASLGAAALDELRRFIDARSPDPAASLAVQNAVEVLGMMEDPIDPDARSLLRQALGHAHEGVRRAAVQGLGRHATPYEYDALFDLCTRSGPELQEEIAVALRRADPARLERDLEGALRAPGLEAAARAAAERLGRCTAAAAARYGDLARKAPPAERPFFAACRALHGDPDALASLRAGLRSENPNERLLFATALAGAGLEAEIAPLVDDPDATLRVLAVDVLGRTPDGDATRATLRRALGDGSADVRRAALAALVGWGDPAAIDLALEGLGRGRGELGTALVALERRWNDDATIARRAFEVLVALHAERSHREPAELAEIEGAISRVPLAEAARFLHEKAKTFPAGSRGARANLRDHRWFVLKAGNAGREGRRYLRERWAEEADPLLRMDLIEAAAFGNDEETRAFLIDVVQSPRTHPYELLLAAMRLAQLGPAAVAAPVLKRATLAVEHPSVRRALHCLLWDWYG